METAIGDNKPMPKKLARLLEHLLEKDEDFLMSLGQCAQRSERFIVQS